MIHEQQKLLAGKGSTRVGLIASYEDATENSILPVSVLKRKGRKNNFGKIYHLILF